jgi:hypothetical protein
MTISFAAIFYIEEQPARFGTATAAGCPVGSVGICRPGVAELQFIATVLRRRYMANGEDVNSYLSGTHHFYCSPREAEQDATPHPIVVPALQRG